jgi:hypothetical protein
MEITAYSLNVTTTRQAITPTNLTDEFGTTVWLYVSPGGSHRVALGGADVTIANGLLVDGGEKFGPVRIPRGESLYVITDHAPGVGLRVLAMGS